MRRCPRRRPPTSSRSRWAWRRYPPPACSRTGPRSTRRTRRRRMRRCLRRRPPTSSHSRWAWRRYPPPVGSAVGPRSTRGTRRRRMRRCPRRRPPTSSHSRWGWQPCPPPARPGSYPPPIRRNPHSRMAQVDLPPHWEAGRPPPPGRTAVAPSRPQSPWSTRPATTRRVSQSALGSSRPHPTFPNAGHEMRRRASPCRAPCQAVGREPPSLPRNGADIGRPKGEPSPATRYHVPLCLTRKSPPARPKQTLTSPTEREADRT